MDNKTWEVDCARMAWEQKLKAKQGRGDDGRIQWIMDHQTGAYIDHLLQQASEVTREQAKAAPDGDRTRNLYSYVAGNGNIEGGNDGYISGLAALLREDMASGHYDPRMPYPNEEDQQEARRLLNLLYDEDGEPTGHLSARGWAQELIARYGGQGDTETQLLRLAGGHCVAFEPEPDREPPAEENK